MSLPERIISFSPLKITGSKNRDPPETAATARKRGTAGSRRVRVAVLRASWCWSGAGRGPQRRSVPCTSHSEGPGCVVPAGDAVAAGSPGRGGWRCRGSSEPWPRWLEMPGQLGPWPRWLEMSEQRRALAGPFGRAQPPATAPSLGGQLPSHMCPWGCSHLLLCVGPLLPHEQPMCFQKNLRSQSGTLLRRSLPSPQPCSLQSCSLRPS